MSVISNLIFKGAKHYVTSPFGTRTVIKTPAGSSASYHQGTDYGTNNIKLPQYTIEDGYVFDAAKSTSDGANYVWVIYPRVKLAMLHYHLDSFKVKAGQRVSKGTLLGYTGMTGKATGIHLHLAVKNLSSLSDAKISAMTWNTLRSVSYTDPEKIKYTAPAVQSSAENASGFLPSKGYFSKGNVSPDVGKIAAFMRNVFPDYTDKKALGNTYGPYLEAAIKEFQKRTGLVPDGKTGPLTLRTLKKFGFKE